MTAEPELLARPLGAGHKLQPIVSLGLQPLANNLVPEASAAQRDPLFPLELMWCEDRRLVQLSASVPPSALFSSYLYFTSFSQVLVDAARANVERQVARWQLGPGDLAMEIGSNDGYLLQHYAARGLTVVGVDPAENVVAEAVKKGVPTRCAFFTETCASEMKNEGIRPKVVHANNVMAHIPDVDGVIRGLDILLHADGVFVAETPYVRRMVEHLEFDTIYHEHLYYYSLTSFTDLLERNGLTTIDVEEVSAHGGSLRITAARVGRYPRSAAASEMLHEEERLGLNTYRYYQVFGAEVPKRLDELRRLLEGLIADGHSVAGYGAAAKATVLLNALGSVASRLAWVADRSVHKHHHLIPGVRLPVVPVERVFEERPDFVLVFAWNYIDEIAPQLAQYRSAGGRLIVPFPQPKVLT